MVHLVPHPSLEFLNGRLGIHFVLRFVFDLLIFYHPGPSSVTANLSARFILDLRSINFTGSRDPASHSMSTIRFSMRSLAGNIGAPVGDEDSTWLSGAADDVANEHGEQYEEADVPFCAGLDLEEHSKDEVEEDPSQCVSNCCS